MLRLPCIRYRSVLRTCALQLEEMRKNEDPRLSFSTPEFKEAQRIFTDNFKVEARAVLPSTQRRPGFSTEQCSRAHRKTLGGP